jgi:hypothetical protein
LRIDTEAKLAGQQHQQRRDQQNDSCPDAENRAEHFIEAVRMVTVEDSSG